MFGIQDLDEWVVFFWKSKPGFELRGFGLAGVGFWVVEPPRDYGGATVTAP